jgi:hypothetical protein
VSHTKQVLDELFSDPLLRKRLAQALQEDGATAPREWWRDRARPFVAGLSSAAVIMLAFLVPSLHDLWDR